MPTSHTPFAAGSAVGRPFESGPPRMVEVALVGAGAGPRTFTYAVPADLAERLEIGSSVQVPLGRRSVAGLVVAEHGGDVPQGLKSISALLPEAPVPAELMALTRWAARYYQVPHAYLLRSVLPPAVRRRTRRHVVPTGLRDRPRSGEDRLLPDDPELRSAAPLAERILDRLPPGGLDLSQLRRDFGDGTMAAVSRLAHRGLVIVHDVAIERRDEVRAFVAGEGGAVLARAPRQAAIYEFVHAAAPHAVARAEIELRFPGSADAIRRLLARGLLRPPSDAELHAPGTRPLAPLVDLSAEQAAALDAVLGALGTFQPFVLFGVTASGKTEVYLRAAAEARARGRDVLLLVPEIGLTPQLVSQASRRFPGEVAVLHSGLTDAERARTWHDVAGGRAPVVIGARSAVFAPLPRLGLVVVDEEHDAAYKQEESPRYHGRDVAVMRAKLAGVPVVLASATPSLESYQAALDGRYRLLELSTRATESPLPVVELIDLRDPTLRSPGPDAQKASPLSPPLEEALTEGYRAGEQSLVFLNRRGFARFIQCEECGRVEDCPHCSVSLTLHRARGMATCHHCGFERRPRPRCPDCSAPLVGRSFGTEQVEEAIARLLPAARIARLDRDTGSSPGYAQATLAAWRRGELDVLVGTQMIAKGHDAPGVTLIGVILADASLHFPDFRASERTFQLLAQVAGRAGRGRKPGRVLVQTRQPEHPSLVAATHHDFRAFAAGELRSRAELDYPPFGRLARLVIEGGPAAIERRAARLAERLRALVRSLGDVPPGTIQVLGPAPAPIERLRGRHRVQLLVKSRDARHLGWLLRAACATERERTSRLVVDVDPASMM